MEDEDESLSDSIDATGSESDYEISPESKSQSNVSECDDEEEEMPADRSSPPRSHQRKSQNVAALVRGNVEVKRQSLFPRVYSVADVEATLRRPFKPPSSSGYSDNKEQLTRRLGARKRFVPWGSTRPVLINITNRLNIPITVENDDLEENVSLPPGVEPLVLWQPEESKQTDSNSSSIVVDTLLVKFLRPHQREGVQFMFDCVSGILSAANINGCILADDMGLGKTLQSITLLYTLLRQGFDGKPMVKKAIIVTPTSLVSNWEAEIKKWVGERVKLVALCESTREDVVSGIDSFTSPRSPLQVLIVSYETFRMHSLKFNQSGSCELLICDEAHRLKNDQTLTNRALAALSCKRRILLSGTPMQNDLEEFYAMVNFTNPGVLGDATKFRRYYEMPIVCGREPTATEEEKRLGSERSGELSGKVNQDNTSNLHNFLAKVKRAISEEAKQSKILAYITALKKLCNHPKCLRVKVSVASLDWPIFSLHFHDLVAAIKVLTPDNLMKLIYDTIKSGSPGTSGFEDCLRFFPQEMFSARSGSWNGGDGVWVELSGKMHVLARLLAHLRKRTDDRIVLVSNYTQDEFAFLLSSKAGGCGLNLIGGNRLVLFDPDWNPANDKQAAARVWRDGQKKRVYIYRFLTTGTIEEKVYQRQMSKEGLQQVIQQEHVDSEKGNLLSTEDLRDLFTFHENVRLLNIMNSRKNVDDVSRSEIHEKMCCKRCEQHEITSDTSFESNCRLDEEDIGGFASLAGCFDSLKRHEKQVGTPKEEDLASWGHHQFPSSVPDSIFQASAGDEVSFVFTNQVDGKLVPVESAVRPMVEEVNENKNQNGFRKVTPRGAVITYNHKRMSPSLSRSGSSSNLKPQPPTQPHSKLMKTGQGKTDVALSPKISPPIQTPSNRLYPAYVNDDDFA
ncbi:protein chromatin remodeling 25 [Phtheirospermum japonicum]|uniref:Protein chromatin remodeling 25 n=1 Tax=Phtheirospermum japonicum TaxID=374723 RepID=A0A830BBX0_9LAMI|nr:protein chromatin remodeling 25 [Phtheirospermum japonicum]